MPRDRGSADAACVGKNTLLLSLHETRTCHPVQHYYHHYINGGLALFFSLQPASEAGLLFLMSVSWHLP